MAFYDKKTVRSNKLGLVLGLIVLLVMVAGLLNVVRLALKGGD